MKRVGIVFAALAVTLGSLWLALALGSVGFDVRRFTQHERRLRKVMAEPQVTAGRLTQAFQEEGTTLVTVRRRCARRPRAIPTCASSPRPTCSISSSSTATA